MLRWPREWRGGRSTFRSVKLAVAPQDAAVGGGVATIQRKLVVEVNGLLQCRLCRQMSSRLSAQNIPSILLESNLTIAQGVFH